MMESLLCPWESPQYLIFSSNVPTLLYYSHLPVLFAALILAIALYRKAQNLSSIILVTILGLFSFYSLLDVLIWATNRSDIVHFLWSVQVMVEVLIFAASFYLVYLVINKKDSSFGSKIFFGIILAPFILLIPTAYNLIGVDLSYCNAIEGPVALYASYAYEIFFAILIVAYSVHKFFQAEERSERKKIALLVLGVILFLVALISGNIIGSFTGDWDLAQFGFFGMPIFIGLLAYLIVEFKMFNLKLIGAQALVLALIGIIASELLFVTNQANRILVLISLFLAICFGSFLVRSVKREVRLREALQEANEGQADLLHIINHQIKGYMTKARYVFDALLNDKDYGPVPENSRGIVEEGYKSVTEGVNFVKDFLEAANIEKGTYAYKMEALDFKGLVEEVAAKLKGSAEAKGLAFETRLLPDDYRMNADRLQLTQALKNLIENSINYTLEGRVSISLTRQGRKAVLKIEDTGVGLSDEVKPKLFTKGGRDKDSQKININSTGFGLAFVKNVAVAHKGRVWAESPGVGKGSTFYMELPLS